MISLAVAQPRTEPISMMARIRTVPSLMDVWCQRGQASIGAPGSGRRRVFWAASKARPPVEQEMCEQDLRRLQAPPRRAGQAVPPSASDHEAAQEESCRLPEC